ncbi:M23 family metallopeptidase [Kocuria sp. M1N1S27]|uniref:M23 family metallopeptidase n=1 Tax=Kocuria kalidii TaxID=3376283 RepID=UPI0037A399B2
MRIIWGAAAGRAVTGRPAPGPHRRTAAASSADAVVLDLPFRGSWRVENSPARRVPSHGTEAFGSSHAIDFVAVDAGGRSAPRTWRSLAAAEPPELFRGFGAPILAPVTGTVVLAHDEEPDHEARRSPLTLVPYMLGQAGRARGGVAALAGNHVVVAVGPAGPFVVLAHLRHGSVQVRPGQYLHVGAVLAECGNSGNSTQPHVHVQVSDSTDWHRAHGVPLAFRDRTGRTWVPAESEVVRA